jgi:hypothetical protein
MKRLVFGATLAAIVAGSTQPLLGFCGFYVAKADTKLFNKASQVVLVRDGDRTVMTMVNDFQGDLKEFAVVIPVPTFLKREQIHVGDKALVDHLDAYSAPRLVEYTDPNPCMMTKMYDRMRMMAQGAAAEAPSARRNASLGVKIEAQYTVGEYDILLLSAEQSSGLETWLRENGYRIPAGASAVLASYLKQNMRFFVAKVNVAEQSKLGFTYLRPLQIAYESPKFMLPIRLGMVNANGPQELFVYALTRKGRVETTNYRTARLPSNMDLPVYLKESSEFAKFYKAMFTRQVEQEQGKVLFLEYAWDMKWCDPCAADPLSNDQLRKLGVFWLDEASRDGASVMRRPMRGASDVFVTRLHVRYDGRHFPEDLVFQTTGDRSNFQGRYVLRHVWTGESTCAAADDYRRSLSARASTEAQTLASLTGWTLADIRRRMGPLPAPPAADDRYWWQRIWR